MATLTKSTPAGIAAAAAKMGKADVFEGDATVAAGLALLGVVEGRIEVEVTETRNRLTFPELTGNAVHSEGVMQDGLKVTIPLILTPAAYDKLSPVGDGGGWGYSTEQDVVPTTLLIIPRGEIGAGFSLASGTFSPAAPTNALWLWRAVPQEPKFGFGYDNRGREIVQVTFECQLDTTKPEGHMLATRGNPVAAGITIAI